MAVTSRCTAGRDSNCNRCDFGDAMDQRSKTLTAVTVDCCMACCYTTGVTAAATATNKYCRKPGKMNPADAYCGSSSSAYDDHYEPPSEAAAFVASASAAALVLLVALLAVVLSSVALLGLTSLAPTAVAAADVLGTESRAADYLHRWHNQREVEQHQQQQQQQQQQSYLWHLQQQQQLSRLDRGGDEDVVRPKRQLLKNNNREPGVVALTFSLIGGTISDAREAYRNVSNIVRDTLSEAARAQQSTTSTAEGDQVMMAAGNSAENEIAASSTAVAPPVDQQMAGQAFSKLFGRNYRGLRRLFDSELRTALKNSPGNVRDFAAELIGSIGQSLRPSKLFTRGPINGDSTTTSNRR